VNPAAGHALDQLTARVESCRPVVLPALLLCDFGHLAREVERLEKAGALALHLDIMDGRFVPQLTYGLVVVEAVRRTAKVPLEVHLMIEEPERSIADYARAGADIVTVHLEGLADPRGTLEAIASLGPRAHLAISPETPVANAVPYLDQCDGVLVMSVEPGYGGQPFNPIALEKVAALREIRRQRGGAFHIGIDGGISAETVGPAAAAGAELIVAGSAVIRSDDYARAISHLEQLARDA
jgi:ribulose-phosphate 3-epimerase